MSPALHVPEGLEEVGGTWVAAEGQGVGTRGAGLAAGVAVASWPVQ